MNTEQAKEILSLYRPETADVEDAYFCEARQLCEQNPELKLWFEDHCAVYRALRAKFKETPIPEGLKEQILAERRIHLPSFWNRSATKILAGLAAVIILFSASMLWRYFDPLERPPNFVRENVEFALRGYGMDLVTTNAQEIRAYLSDRKSPADYTLPEGLKKATIAGCVAMTWNGKPMSMICFQSGKPLRPGQLSDLWLFVADRDDSVPGSPKDTAPSLSRVNTATAATWTAGSKRYLLVIEANAAAIRKFL